MSYNALPGGHLRETLRRLIPAGPGGVEEPREREAAAWRFLAMLVEAGEADDERVLTRAEPRGRYRPRRRFLFHECSPTTTCRST